jgi:DNA replication protein DnaC
VTLNRRVSSFLRRAHLPKSVSMAEVWPRPGLSARKLDNLAQCGWLSGGKNLVIIGEHGVGKTFLVGALSREAVRQTSSVRWHRVAAFLDECTEAKPEDLQKTLKTLSVARLLVLDGFAEHVTLDSSAQLLKALLDARTAAGLVTIVVSGRPVEEWDTLFQDQSVANALFHRVLDRAMVIELERAQGTAPRKTSNRQMVRSAT